MLNAEHGTAASRTVLLAPENHPRLFDLRLFESFADEPCLLLAVSGGPDSMALLHLAADWSADAMTRGRDPPRLFAATVDHGFRPEAQREAALVSCAARSRGIPHETLSWEGPRPATRLQERARDARYDLLEAHAKRVGATMLLTAHHADDHAETVLMRLGRGSGIKGLAGMRARVALRDDLVLARPLLRVTKADLVSFCAARAVEFCRDPSNEDLRFARTRLRANADRAAALGLSREALLRLARRAERADLALDQAAAALEAQLAPFLDQGRWAVSLAGADSIAPELLGRLLMRAVRHVTDLSEGVRHCRLDRVERLADSIAGALRAETPLRTTLHGSRVLLGADGQLAVIRERPRRRGRGVAGEQRRVKGENPQGSGRLGNKLA